MKVVNLAVILFYDDNGNVLLQDRRNMSKYGEDWGVFGGSIEDGESVEQALVREIKEELDYDLEEYEFLAQMNYDYLDITVEKTVFASKLPKDYKERFTVLEGAGMDIFSVEEALKLNLIHNIDKVLVLFMKSDLYKKC